MLKTLHISNYALIDVIDIEFTDGFNVLTGETGAGKSIILGALSLLLGSRADSKVVRDKSKKSIIEALFVGIHSDVAETLKNEDIDSTGDEILLRREVDASSGRSRA
ncbi:MAG: AAA family ATPase, partial [Muribaculaceae bacterium]|nr:AAA family ATPase [Muribaculaceae bacterium]